MPLLTRLVIGAVLLAMPRVTPCQEFPKWHQDDNVYNRIARLRGQVSIVNHPTLGRAPAASTYLVFQRQGCKDCLVATWTDADGKYELFLGPGRYKLIVREGRGGPTASFDLLAPKQARWVNVSGRNREVTFDIQIALRPNE
jgi:hypothetical protein